MKTAHCYNWQESALHGAKGTRGEKGATAYCGHQADPTKPLEMPRSVGKMPGYKQCEKCLAATQPKKVIIVRHEMSEADYGEARQFFSDSEMRTILLEDGANWLRNRVKAALAGDTGGIE